MEMSIWKCQNNKHREKERKRQGGDQSPQARLRAESESHLEIGKAFHREIP